MEKRFAALRILLFASLLLALAAGAAFAAAIPGTCSGTITKNPCPTYDYDTCIRVAGCSADHPGGYCKAASGGNINGHTYEWYCTGVAAGIGYDTCQSNDQMSNGIWYHPARNAHECRIYPCCVPNPDGTSTCPLGCTWTGQECAGTATGSCSPYGNSRTICEELGCDWISAPCEWGQVCDTNADCCGQYPACRSLQSECGFDSDCLDMQAGATCDPVTGFCVFKHKGCQACAASGGGCSLPTDCCSGLSCNTATHQCEAPPPPSIVCSKEEGETCSSLPGDCCKAAPLFCDDVNRNPAVCRSCVTLGETCGGSMKCCSPGLSCDAVTSKCEKNFVGVCASDEFNSVTFLSALAGLAMAILIALAYMAGEFFQSPRFTTWAKSEAMQLFVSLAIVAILLFALSAFCSVEVGEVGTIFSQLPHIYQSSNYEKLNLYDAATLYLENLQGVGLRNMVALRFNLAAYEIRTSFSKFVCQDSTCFVSMVSYNEALHGGETLHLAITNNLLGTATVSYLTATFQYFTLQYIVSGLYLVFLPLAIVIRSIPFMRGFGGALIGIFLALYLLYPLMLISNAVIAPYISKGIGGAQLFDHDGKGCPAGTEIFQDPGGGQGLLCTPGTAERELGGKGVHESDLPNPDDLLALMKTNVLIFMASVFLPAINFVVVAALARDLSKLLGEEADISRLGQMV